MKNPLSPQYSESANQALVQRSLDGDSGALDELIHLHQPFIYNVAWKMAHDPNDALDLTQEVLIKVITKLSQFNFKSSFRTWLYRIVINEFLQSKRRQRETQFSTLDAYGEQLDSIPNPELTREEEIEFEELSKEMQLRCMSGMLMCLDREQRLIYILGDTFAIDHKLGAQLFDISPQNFRVKLHRARKELSNFMNNKCGLVNKGNPCRCPKKTKVLKSQGVLEEGKMEFNQGFRTRIFDYVTEEHTNLMDSIEDKVTVLFRAHPTKDNFSKDTIVKEILNDPEIMRHFGS